MRKMVALGAAVLMLAGVTAGSPVAAEPGPGYFATDNVEWLTTIPIETDGAGARLVGDHFYVTTSRTLSIYDVSAPEAPTRVGTLALPQQPQFAEEDLDTNGEILLIGTLGDLHVINVEDKSNPTPVATLAGADEHTISCILDCKYAYGSEGVIVDLRDPTAPKIVGNWADKSPAPNGGHDVTEVAPGLVVTSTQPIMMLDARKNPAKPRIIAMGANDDDRFIHGNLWPNRGKARYLLVGGESSGNCDAEGAGQFMTWDTKGWRKHHTFKMVDELAMQNGLPTEGDMPANTFCAHWFETHPTYRNGGLVAMDWYEHGTRFLNISTKGKISEVGSFVALASAASAPYWVTDEILYSVDYNRGIDILRFTGKP